METANRVAVVTVTYGNRWRYLSQTLDSVLHDPHVCKIVIVDNGSTNKEAIEHYAHEYAGRIDVLRSEKNLGSAGGFAKGIEHVRTVDCEYVLMLDDDNVPEDGAIGTFLEQKKKFENPHVVLVGNRLNIPGNEAVFYSNETKPSTPRGTFFEIFSWKKIQHFFSLIAGNELKKKSVRTSPRAHIANESFVYGGAFVPIDAIRRAPLPDRELVLYGDDIEYSWGIKRLGYESYVCFSPKIHDVDMSFGEGSQVAGLFGQNVALFKVYFRIRNMIRISIRNTDQHQAVLFLSIILWLIGLLCIGLARYGFNRNFFNKLRIILSALYGGYVTKAAIPQAARIP
jgi:GT2 family glycosyltransferase